MSLSQHISTGVLKRSAVGSQELRTISLRRGRPAYGFNPSSLEVICENVESLHISDVCDFAA